MIRQASSAAALECTYLPETKEFSLCELAGYRIVGRIRVGAGGRVFVEADAVLPVAGHEEVDYMHRQAKKVKG